LSNIKILDEQNYETKTDDLLQLRIKRVAIQLDFQKICKHVHIHKYRFTEIVRFGRQECGDLRSIQ
jgi:hypothetical protein